MAKPIISQDYVKAVLHYEPETGIFTWKIVASKSTVKIGDRAGTVATWGYRIIKMLGIAWREHRLAWLYVHGEFPPDEIDHINGDRSDNRLCNLRAATRRENMQNIRTSYGKSGYTGVGKFRNGEKWFARIKIDGKYKYLGLFETPELASSAYVAAKRELHPFSKFARENSQ